MHVLIPVCGGIPASSFYQDFSDSIVQALHVCGHSAERFEFGKIGKMSSAELGRLPERALRSRAITLSGNLWRHRVETLPRIAGELPERCDVPAGNA